MKTSRIDLEKTPDILHYSTILFPYIVQFYITTEKIEATKTCEAFIQRKDTSIPSYRPCLTVIWYIDHGDSPPTPAFEDME